MSVHDPTHKHASTSLACCTLLAVLIPSPPPCACLCVCACVRVMVLVCVCAALGTPFSGKFTLVYFGFTYCPDICPSELVKMGKVRERLRHP